MSTTFQETNAQQLFNIGNQNLQQVLSQNLQQTMASTPFSQPDVPPFQNQQSTQDQINYISYQQAQQMNNLATLQMILNMCPKYDENVNYSQEFMKVLITNEFLHNQIQELLCDRSDLGDRINKLENMIDNHESNNLNDSQSDKKKIRRTAQEIEKTFICPYNNCQKGYGSDVSLNLHIKIKHNGGSKTEREKLAKAIMLAKINKYQMPKLDIEFPPGYLENFEQYMMKDLKKEKEEENKQQNNPQEQQKLTDNTHLINSTSKESDISTQSETHHHLHNTILNHINQQNLLQQQQQQLSQESILQEQIKLYQQQQMNQEQAKQNDQNTKENQENEEKQQQQKQQQEQQQREEEQKVDA